MNFLRLILVLAIIFEAVAFESSLVEFIASLNATIDEHDKRLQKFKEDVEAPIPAFMASMKTYRFYNELKHIPKNGVIKFENVELNVNGCYDQSTGVFKAPVSGTYYFSFTLVTTYIRDPKYYPRYSAEIVAGDGGMVIGFMEFNGSDDEARTIHTLVHLDAEEKVWIRCLGYDCYNKRHRSNVFLGFLVDGR